MRLVHLSRPNAEVGGDGPSVLATEIERAESTLAQAKGLMFRSNLPDDFALVLPVEETSWWSFRPGPKRQFVHMLCMRVPIDVIWTVDNEVTAVRRMHPWRSVGVARADRIIELPAGAGAEVSVGDEVWLEAESG